MSRIPGQARPKVVLVHGIWNAAWWLAPLAWRLRRAGFETELFGYPSIVDGVAAAVPRLAARLASGPPVHVVGHSLGGLLALETLRLDSALPVERVVCLGSPLCGSQTARALAARPGMAWTLGRSGKVLEHGCAPWVGGAAVGMIAGTRPRGVGRLLACVDEDSDGTVALAETRLEGLAAHCRVPVTHTGLVLSAKAARQTAAFLRTGAFLADAAEPTAERGGPV